MSDWYMRYITELTRNLATFVFARNLSKHELFDEEGRYAAGELLFHTVKGKLLEGKVNEAENLLFETIEADPREEYLPAALDFYEELAGMDTDALAACNFTPEEVAEGLRAVHRIYGMALPGQVYES